MSDIYDRLRKLLLKQNFEIENLNEVDRHIVLVAATLAIPMSRELSEREITELLIQWCATVGSNIHADAVEIRRYLVDHKLLQRDPAGHRYSRPAQLPAKFQAIVQELEKLQIAELADRVRTEESERRAERKRAALAKQGDLPNHDRK